MALKLRVSYEKLLNSTALSQTKKIQNPVQTTFNMPKTKKDKGISLKGQKCPPLTNELITYGAKLTPNPTKLDSLTQTNGQAVEEKKPIPRTMDEVWGYDGLSRYKTTDLSVYEGQLKEMTKADLQNHAMKLGEAPIDDYPRLKKHLINVFLRHRANYAKKPEPVGKPKELTPEVRRILAEGK